MRAHYVLLGALVALASSLATLLVLLFAPIEVAHWEKNSRGNEFTVLEPVVHRGQEMRTSTWFCKYLDIPAKTRVWVEVGGALTEISPIGLPVTTTGCYTRQNRYAVIPKALPAEATSPWGAGRARLKVQVTYQVTAFREVTYTLWSDEFLIAE